MLVDRDDSKAGPDWTTARLSTAVIDYYGKQYRILSFPRYFAAALVPADLTLEEAIAFCDEASNHA